MDIFILYEFVKSSAFSAPCQPGSIPMGYVWPLGVAVTGPVAFAGNSHPEWKTCSDLEKMSLYRNPVYIENRPISRMMYRPLQHCQHPSNQ